MISGMSGSDERKWVPMVGSPAAKVSRKVFGMIIRLVLSTMARLNSPKGYWPSVRNWQEAPSPTDRGRAISGLIEIDYLSLGGTTLGCGQTFSPSRVARILCSNSARRYGLLTIMISSTNSPRRMTAFSA